MRISGFSMVKNATKLYYPIKEAIESILPICDEFVIAIGDCDVDDNTRQLVESINNPKIKIIDTVWDVVKYTRGTEHAHQTDIAKSFCTGDWLIYVQADEVIHEKYLDVIEHRCKELLNDKEVEGLLFKYLHFWGDYDHYQWGHTWYKNEIRIIRNDPQIHSWESAQSFRRIPNFDGLDYRCDKKLTSKLKVAEVDAYIYHYGWVRPPSLMERKTKAFNINHKGAQKAEEMDEKQLFRIDYGPLGKTQIFNGTHPQVMDEKINEFDWAHELNYTNKRKVGAKRSKHDKLRYRLLTLIEKHFFPNGLFTFKNYKLLKKK